MICVSRFAKINDFKVLPSVATSVSYGYNHIRAESSTILQINPCKCSYCRANSMRNMAEIEKKNALENSPNNSTENVSAEITKRFLGQFYF